MPCNRVLVWILGAAAMSSPGFVYAVMASRTQASLCDQRHTRTEVARLQGLSRGARTLCDDDHTGLGTQLVDCQVPKPGPAARVMTAIGSQEVWRRAQLPRGPERPFAALPRSGAPPSDGVLGRPPVENRRLDLEALSTRSAGHGGPAGATSDRWRGSIFDLGQSVRLCPRWAG